MFALPDMVPLCTEIDIDAPPGQIWEVLTDFDQHPEWNPFAVSISGRLEAGEKLRMHLNRPRPFGMVFYPRVTQVETESTFRFLGQFIIPSLFSGEHIFELQAIDDGSTCFVHREEFHGFIPSLLGQLLDKMARGNYEAFNIAIKQRVEETSAAIDS